jgi:3-oxoacyl-[acyl-carrier protein] reductase
VNLCDLAPPDVEVEENRKAGGEAIRRACDVPDRTAFKVLADETVRAFGRVQILVQNAGLFVGLALESFAEINSAD